MKSHTPLFKSPRFVTDSPEYFLPSDFAGGDCLLKGTDLHQKNFCSIISIESEKGILFQGAHRPEKWRGAQEKCIAPL